MRTKAITQAKQADERLADQRAAALLTVEAASRHAVRVGVPRRGVLRYAAVALGFTVARPLVDATAEN